MSWANGIKKNVVFTVVVEMCSWSLFLHLAKEIENDILNGTLKDGKPAPSANELARDFCVNHNTAAKALSKLSHREILYKKRGIGAFVISGAREQILMRRMGEFARCYIEPMLAEAELLGISKSDLTNLLLEENHPHDEDKKQAVEENSLPLSNR